MILIEVSKTCTDTNEKKQSVFLALACFSCKITSVNISESLDNDSKNKNRLELSRYTFNLA